MKILEILAVSIVGVSFAMVIRPYRPEMALLTGIVTGVIVLLSILAELTGVVDTLLRLAERYALNTEILGVLLKITGIAYLAQIGGRICTDAGESAVGAKVEMCGRILILGAALPQLLAALDTASELLAGLTP